MTHTKHLKWSAGMLAVTIALSSSAMMVQASGSVKDSTDGGYVTPVGNPIDGDGDAVAYSSACSYGDGYMSIDTINPGQTIYIPLGSSSNLTFLNDSSGSLSSAYAGMSGIGMDLLSNSDYFKMSTDKDGTGKSLISSVTQVNEKTIGSNSRQNYLKIVISDSTTTSDLKAELDITFKARSSKTESAMGVGSSTSDYAWNSGDYATLKLTLWINNTEISGSDGSADAGSSVYYNPESNDNNTFVWGDDRASLTFATDSDATSFYAKLSTKSNSTIYATYGDPVNADLYFYDFVGNPTVPTTSRATLTLGIPWEEDDSYVPDPENCYIYQLSSDGTLTDITSQFVYSEDDYEIAGWSVKTRTLGTYILSDAELELDEDEDYDIDEDIDYEVSTPTTEGEKVIPDTGAYDLTGLAVATGAISLAAGCVAAFGKTA